MKFKHLKKLFVNLFLVAIILIVNIFFVSGCSRNAIGYHIKSLPNKIVYAVGETVKFDGLKIESLNADGSYHTFCISEKDIAQVDTSTPGKKNVEIERNNMALSFDIYVANTIVNDSDNLKDIIANASNDDILYLRQGEYKSQTDEFKDIVVEKSLTFVGDGADKTKFFGNFIVGATLENGIFTKVNNLKNIQFIGIGFQQEYEIKNNFVNYNNAYGSTDYNGAIRCFDTKNLTVSNCNFSGYAYGILGENANGLYVNGCKFKNIFKTAIKITNDVTNSTIFKNIFADIATNMIAFEGNEQSNLGAISLSFASTGQKGVIISKNSFSRIGLHNDDVIYYDMLSKQTHSTSQVDVYKYLYINNTSTISFLSTGGDDLDVFGVILSANNYMQTLQNLYSGTKGKNTVSQNGIITLD